jgi:hypothetical protein
VTVSLERSEIMLFVRIVGVAKVVIDLDGLDDARDGFGTERSNSSGHNGLPTATADVSPQIIVERTDAVGLAW